MVSVRTGLSLYIGSTETVVCVRTGLSVYIGSNTAIETVVCVS